MEAILTIIAVLIILAIILGVYAIALFCQEMLCKDCPFKHECDKHQEDPKFVPTCQRNNHVNYNSID